MVPGVHINVLFLSPYSIKIHDLSDLKGVYTIIDVEEEKGMVGMTYKVHVRSTLCTYYICLRKHLESHRIFIKVMHMCIMFLAIIFTL